MILKSIKYSQFKNQPGAWYLDEFKLNKINLIVGKNASGKTRVLNIINGLANLVSGDQKLIFRSGEYTATFEENRKSIKYVLFYENAKIIKEELIIDKESYLKRGHGGRGNIYANELKQDMKFQTPDDELACVARRDSVQHPFFEQLYQWGKSTRHYLFGSQLGKDQLAVFEDKVKAADKIDFKQTNRVVEFFKKGSEKHGKAFTDQIKKEMKAIGYKIDDIGIDLVTGIIVPAGAPSQISGLYVKETDLKNKTTQLDMSQGMFRALSLLIQLNFSQLESIPSCILIDDIGEGLDFERSTALIKILIEKANESSIQLIMSTNDRFVMNNVPLEYWSVIKRNGERCRIYNYKNSKKVFDEFEFTGLSNFDFLATDFYLKGFSKN